MTCFKEPSTGDGSNQMIHAAYEHVVLFDWMVEELVRRHPDVDRAVIECIAADVWFHVQSWFPDSDPMAADRSWGLGGWRKANVSHLPIRTTAGDRLDVREYPEDD